MPGGTEKYLTPQESIGGPGKTSPMRNLLRCSFIILATIACLAWTGAAEEPGLTPARTGGKSGFMDRTGRMIIAPKFDRVDNFSEGLAAASVNNKYGFIDPSGKFIIQPAFEYAYQFSDGLAAIRQGKAYGFIDRQGKVVVPAIYSEVGTFNSGRAWVRKKDGSQYPPYGFVDKSGKLVVPFIYTGVHNFSEGLAWVTDGRPGRFIDPSGAVALDLTKRRLVTSGTSFSEGLCAVATFTDRRIGFMDKTGQLRIPGAFQDTHDFSQGLAPVRLKDKWGFIDTTGNLVIPAIYEEAFPFAPDGLAVVAFEKGSWGYVDRQGKVPFKQRFTNAGYFVNGLAYVVDGNHKSMYIDTKGKVVWRP